MALKVTSSAADLNIKMTNILKIENFLNDSSYSELIEFSANFNSRLCIERRLRMPFHDPQTGVAQKHSNLYLKKSQRLPGLKEGQIYTYPSNRWRCKKTSLKFSNRPFYRFRAADTCPTATTTVAPNLATLTPGPSSSSLNSTVASAADGDVSDFQALIDAESNSLDTDSKDSQILKEETMTKDWFFDDMDVNDVGSEEAPDSDFEYSINGYKRKRKPVTTRKSSRKPKDPHAIDGTTKKPRSASSGASSNSRSNRNRKSSSRSSKPSKADGSGSRSFADVEPPSFESVEGDLIDGGAYRNF